MPSLNKGLSCSSRETQDGSSKLRSLHLATDALLRWRLLQPYPGPRLHSQARQRASASDVIWLVLRSPVAQLQPIGPSFHRQKSFSGAADSLSVTLPCAMPSSDAAPRVCPSVGNLNARSIRRVFAASNTGGSPTYRAAIFIRSTKHSLRGEQGSRLPCRLFAGSVETSENMPNP